MTGFNSKRAMAQDKLKGATVKAYVNTVISQEIEVPEGTTKQDVLNFLAENQSFNDAFAGVSDRDQTMRITNVCVIDESIDSIGEEAYDE